MVTHHEVETAVEGGVVFEQEEQDALVVSFCVESYD